MSTEGIPRRIETWRQWVERELDERLPASSEPPRRLHQAMRHSLFAGGKRLRPILCLAACRAAGGQEMDALAAAAALEMVHTYTLIHDDLPCMDDDDLRRGRSTCHRAFGEEVAILAGLSLLVRALEILSESPPAPELRRRMLQILCRECGVDGVTGGQVEDLLGEGVTATVERVHRIHRLKTASLIRASLVLGALAADARSQELQALDQAGLALGHAFQITDDILGETGTAEELGKPVGADRDMDKATMVRALGLAEARQDAQRWAGEARSSLQGLSGHTGPLLYLVDLAVSRRR